MKKPLEKLVRAARTAKETDDALRKAGYTDTPYFDIYGDIVDGIYELLGEKTNCLEESVTYTVLSNMELTDAQCAEWFDAEFRRKNVTASICDGTRNTLIDTAKARGLDVQSMVKLILCEWASRQTHIKETF